MTKFPIACVNRAQRITRTRELKLHGHSDNQIAAILGVTTESVRSYMKEIYQDWAAAEQQLEDKRRQIIEMLLNMTREAMTAWEKSKCVKKKCKDCKGSGMASKTEWCITCNGDGYVMERDLPGDTSHLSTASLCTVRAAKFMGLLVGLEPSPKQQQQFNLIYQAKGESRFDNVPAEVLLDARSAFRRLLESANGQGKVVDVESKEEEEDESQSGG